MRATSLAAILMVFATASAGAAEGTKSLGRFGAWEAYSYGEGAGKVCYAASAADKTQGGNKGRVATGLAITHRGKSVGEVSVMAGYGLKKDSEAELLIGGMKHTFFTQGNSAWAKDARADKAILSALVKARDVVIKTSPAKGSAIADTISLSGFGQALAAIDKACNVKR